jgi:cob(I)alamin adenosyltransferase
MTPHDRMTRIDELLSHVWMVRTFLKHSEEAEDIEELREVQRELYDYLLALGESWKNQNAEGYLKIAAKKYAGLKRVTQRFVEEQPDISTHTNFQMAARSLAVAVAKIEELLA